MRPLKVSLGRYYIVGYLGSLGEKLKAYFDDTKNTIVVRGYVEIKFDVMDLDLQCTDVYAKEMEKRIK